MLLVTAGVPAGAVAADDGRPLADAGLDQSTTVGSTVYLDGGGSLDPDGELVDYEWSIRTPSGDTVDPADPEAVMTQFVPDESGRYHVRLTVTDEDGQPHSDTLYVDVERADAPPSTATPTPTATPRDTGHQPTPEGVGLSVDSRSDRPYWAAGEYSPFTFSVPDFRAR